MKYYIILICNSQIDTQNCIHFESTFIVSKFLLKLMCDSLCVSRWQQKEKSHCYWMEIPIMETKQKLLEFIWFWVGFSDDF